MSKKFLILLFLTMLLTSGCIKLGSSKKPVVLDGGVYKSLNKGVTWQQKTLIPSVTGKTGSFSGLNIASMTMDGSDENAFYYGSVNNGLFFTYDGAESWFSAKSLGAKTISSIEVDAKDHCTIYVGIGNRIFKTEDCSRSWQGVYYDNEVLAVIDALVVDHYDNNNVYAAISRGDIIKSTDGGANWQTLQRLNNRIKKMLIDPNDSRIIYVVTTSLGVFRSIDGGETWENMEELKEFLASEKLGLDIRDILMVKDDPGTIFLATYYGLLKSIDAGVTWQNIKLILPSTKATINAIAVNPLNLNEIFYVTNTTFYSSSDGGQSWSTLKLPSTRPGMKLFINPKEPNVMYMGVK